MHIQCGRIFSSFGHQKVVGDISDKMMSYVWCSRCVDISDHILIYRYVSNVHLEKKPAQFARARTVNVPQLNLDYGTLL